MPIYTKYNRFTERFLNELAENIEYDNNGKIKTIWLYHDGTNPMNQDNMNNRYWKIYFDRLKKLSKLSKK